MMMLLSINHHCYCMCGLLLMTTTMLVGNEYMAEREGMVY
jgi:hypothetical protein